MLKKSIPMEKGRLFYITAGRRYPLADFDGEIRIYEEQELVPLLGSLSKGRKKIRATILICGDVKYLTDTEIYDYMCFEAMGVINKEQLLLSALDWIDSGATDNTLTFEITDAKLVEKLIAS